MKTSALALVLFASGTVWADKVPAKQNPKQPVIDAATAGLIPDAGWLITYQVNAGRVIARITKTGVKELLRTPEDSSAFATWVDGKTLLDVDIDFEKNIEIKWFVDGVLDAKRTIKHKAAVWGRKSDEDSVNVEGLYRTADGAIWLERCISELLPDCTKSTWMRLDGAATKVQRARPAKLIGFGNTVKAPTVKAPAGFSGKLIKVKSKDAKRRISAIECTGPKGKLVWTEESPPIDDAERLTMKKVRWISVTPPLFEVEGKFVNPVGQVEIVQYVFRDCAGDAYAGVWWIADHAWAYTTRDDSDDNFHVMVDDKPVAIVAGYGVMAAPK